MEAKAREAVDVITGTDQEYIPVKKARYDSMDNNESSESSVDTELSLDVFDGLLDISGRFFRLFI